MTFGPMTYLERKLKGNNRMSLKQERSEGAYGIRPARPARYGEAILLNLVSNGARIRPPITAHIAGSLEYTNENEVGGTLHPVNDEERPHLRERRGTYVVLERLTRINAGLPTGREANGNGASIVVRGRESRPHGEVRQVLLSSITRRYAECRTPMCF